MSAYFPVLLRQLLVADIRAELHDALASKQAGEPPVVSLGFQFWPKHHPEMLATLDQDIETAWRQVVREIRGTIDQSLGDFIHKRPTRPQETILADRIAAAPCARRREDIACGQVSAWLGAGLIGPAQGTAGLEQAGLRVNGRG